MQEEKLIPSQHAKVSDIDSSSTCKKKTGFPTFPSRMSPFSKHYESQNQELTSIPVSISRETQQIQNFCAQRYGFSFYLPHITQSKSANKSDLFMHINTKHDK